MRSTKPSRQAALAVWLYCLLVVVPVLCLIGGAFFAGRFISAPDLWIWCGGAALVHAALFHWAYRYKDRQLNSAGASTSKRSGWSRPLLLVSALLFFGVWVIDDVFVAAELAWAVGTPVARTATMVSKSRSSGKGCNHTYWSAPDGPADFPECIDSSSYRSVHIGDRKQIRVLVSPLGSFVSSDETYLP